MFYPRNIEGNTKKKYQDENLAIQLYGKRIYEGQTVGEYLLEFLLVFLGTDGGNGGFPLEHSSKDELIYYTNPNIGLKRFIFFENSKNENRHPIDKDANQDINRLIKEQIKSDKFSEEQILYQLKDLFYGFNLITKQRSWFAQAMMPLCKELVFCEAQNNNKRKKSDYKYINDNNQIDKRVDNDFAYTKHSFLGRGGEVYFMHLLQGLQEMEDKDKANELKKELEQGLNKLLDSFPQFQKLSKFIQSTWEKNLSERMERSPDDEGDDWVRKHHRRIMTCEWIKGNYVKVAHFSLDEMRNILKTSINQLEKLELLNIGIILHIFRMMTFEAYNQAAGTEGKKPLWVIQVPSKDKVNSKVKMMAVKYYSDIENYMVNALSIQLEIKKQAQEGTVSSRNDDIKQLKDAYKNSHKLLRKIGKDIGFIIPISGQNMRFTITDKIMRYFVLAMVEPGTSITLDSFLEKLYRYYGIIIREDEYISHYKAIGEEDVHASFMEKNLEEFSIQLRNNGYLKELSDATAIVTNPYECEVQ